MCAPSRDSPIKNGLAASGAPVKVMTSYPANPRLRSGIPDFAITMGAITSPGRFQLIVPDVPSIGAAGAYPDVLSPAFVVPCGVLLHALSLRQLIRRRAA